MPYNKKAMYLFFSCLIKSSILSASQQATSPYHQTIEIVGENIDTLLLKGTQTIEKYGKRDANSTNQEKQTLNISYILLNPMNQLHTIGQPESTQKFCKKLIAYLKTEASQSPTSTLDENNNEITPNYGHYIFHQKVAPTNNNQYNWVIEQLKKNTDSRKALININQLSDKTPGKKDASPILGIQFFIKANYLSCNISCLHTNIYTQMPYDIGFFSFVTGLVYKDLKEKLPSPESAKLSLGHVKIAANFSKMSAQALKASPCAKSALALNMPPIEDPQGVLQDIYNQTAKTKLMLWIYQHAGIPKPE
ncbi:MAG: hypothetical protein P4L31_03250 [Candidatus Babeliales bacterium]|nr:hypothetical protein [Candidatus Babeliales bacterium]